MTQWDTISQGKPTTREEFLINIDPVGLHQDPITGTEQAAIRTGRFKLLLGNPGQNLQHVSRSIETKAKLEQVRSTNGSTVHDRMDGFHHLAILLLLHPLSRGQAPI